MQFVGRASSYFSEIQELLECQDKRIELHRAPGLHPLGALCLPDDKKTRIVSTTARGTYDFDRAATLDRHGNGCK
jgi:hypothetical protein